jgi:SNF2 family DNA or RNA helicase
VVTPASVVHNWVSEAARFAPDLTIRAVTQTEARRGCGLAEAATGADVVVTSYTLFRLEFDDYRALKWDGLVLDEAQFIKNAQAVAHRCAKRLPAPFKLAITGTPMENNLAELWALCSVTAPGLFPRLDRFTEYYRNPIEKGHDVERLALLRRRIRPLMLRRRKADVVSDLPDKQEQVIELELAPKHRRMYQTYLQRERQKVLGLLGDLEQHRFEIFRSLTLLRQASLDVTLVDPKHRGVPSTKLDVLTEQVTSLVAEGHRTLVFSQFTRFLAAARARLEDAGVPCCYLDGSTRDRARVLADFKNGAAPVFLISLKAGGFGLNLTEADYCILLDPWWNPATEAQAVDRVHRIGQTRGVMVYRLVAKDTIEEKVMALKARKAELFSSVLDGGDFASARLTASDIRALLE